jgi:hypothetical protein
MNRHLFSASLLFLLLVAVCSCREPHEKKAAVRVDRHLSKIDSIKQADSIEKRRLIEDFNLNHTDTIAVGDVDGNGTKDIAYIQPYDPDSDHVTITFSCDIPAIENPSGFSGLIANVGDLDGNKTEELMYYPDWYQSNSAGIFIYGYTHKKWKLFAQGTVRRDIIADSKDPIAFLKSRIQKINNKSFRMVEHIWRDSDIVDSTRIVRIKD